MRKDMKKVLVTCYRQGANKRPSMKHVTKNEGVQRLRREEIKFFEYEDEEGDFHWEVEDRVRTPKKQGIRHRSQTKDFGENLQPLKRFLNSKVGQNWDKIYSEICEVCDRKGAVSGHIFDHIFFDVTLAKYVYFVDGKPWSSEYGGGQPIETSNLRWPQFWVHPKTGCLMKAPVRFYPKKEKEDDLRLVSRKKKEILWLSRNKEGNWFLLTYLPQEWIKEVREWVREIPKYPEASCSTQKPDEPYKKGFYLASCKSLSKQLKKKYHLR